MCHRSSSKLSNNKGFKSQQSSLAEQLTSEIAYATMSSPRKNTAVQQYQRQPSGSRYSAGYAPSPSRHHGSQARRFLPQGGKHKTAYHSWICDRCSYNLNSLSYNPQCLGCGHQRCGGCSKY